VLFPNVVILESFSNIGAILAHF